ncbi:MAG: STAS domain-containing protein [Nitrospirae bacterium]|nr:STAS domain-containing protein [Nitrospirota bacterium]MCL5977786.1 STAS domain-containing protein [Nitrospirota bacterium]
MLNFRFEKSGDFGVLTFDGELTAEHAGGLKEALMVSLDNAEHVVVDFEKVTEIDEDCLQLFSTTCGRLARLKKCLTLTGACPEIFKKTTELIEANNFIKFVNGKRDVAVDDSFRAVEAGATV